ncbi:MAG: hypothetical protein ACREH8_09545 [Opitutaceae bacterium]
MKYTAAFGLFRTTALHITAWLACAAAGAPPLRVEFLPPGFTVRELPTKLTSINNVEYTADGRLFAAGYDGRVHLLRDTDGDGLEEKVDAFWEKTSSNYPLGIAVREGEPYLVLSNAVVRFRDRDGDGVPETREIFAKDFDLPELTQARYLLHVDVSVLSSGRTALL